MLPEVIITARNIHQKDIRQIYVAVLNLLELRGFGLQPARTSSVSGLFRNIKIIDLTPQSSGFRIDIKRKSGWQYGLQIGSPNDWISAVHTHLQPAIDEIGFSPNIYPSEDNNIDLTNLSRSAIHSNRFAQSKVGINEEQYSKESLRRLTTDQIERRSTHMVDRRDSTAKYRSSPLRDDYDDLDDE